MTTILLTGATGTLGRELIPRLLQEGYAVRAMTSRSDAPPTRPGLTWVRADLAGPEVLDYRQLASGWLAARGSSKRIVHVPLPGRVAAAFRAGATTAPEAAQGVITWGEWVQRRYAVEVRGARPSA